MVYACRFIGSGIFCFKVCDPTVKSPNYCENRFDLIGCAYNMPASYKDGEFTSCDGELQDVVGVYTGANGQGKPFIFFSFDPSIENRKTDKKSSLGQISLHLQSGRCSHCSTSLHSSNSRFFQLSNIPIGRSLRCRTFHSSFLLFSSFLP
jgi:hypothetical protein